MGKEANALPGGAPESRFVPVMVSVPVIASPLIAPENANASVQEPAEPPGLTNEEELV
jgi:hypothetical protein